MVALVSVSVFSLFSLAQVPLISAGKLLSVVKNYFKCQLSDHYSVDFLGKDRVF